MKKKLPLILLFIAGLAAFLRFYTVNKLMVFTPDEEYFLYIVQTLIKNFHVIWIGVSALGFDFYMGPGWVYFLYPFVALAKGDPLVIGLIASSFGVLTVIVIYWFAKELFNKKVGIISALIYASSALIVYYDQQPYPTGVPLLSLGLAISLYMTKKSKWWWVMFALLYGIVFHIHLSLILVAFIGLYWLINHPKSINLKVFLFSVLAFLFAISPLIVFDYFHKASNITAPIRVFQAAQKNTTKLDLGHRFEILAKSVSRVWYLDLGKSNTDEILYPCNSVLGNNSTPVQWIVVVFIVILILSFFSKKDVWKNEGKRLLILFSFAFLVPFVFLPSIGSVEYYLLGFFPILVIAIASVIEAYKKPIRIILYAILAAFVIYNSITVLRARGDFGLEVKKDMVQKVMKVVGNSTFELSEDGGACQGSAGWRYLFLSYGRRPEKSSEDRVFSWLWPDEVSTSKTKYSVEIIETRSGKGDNFSEYKTKIIDGGFSAFVREN